MPLKINIEEHPENIFMVRLEGRLDTHTYLLLKEKLAPLLVVSSRALIFDMAKLDYISSAGLGVIFQARKTIEKNNGRFIMTNLQPQIKKAFEIVDSWPGKAIFKSMEEVDRYLDFMMKKEVEKSKFPPKKRNDTSS